MARPIWGTGNAQAITGRGKITSVQVTTSAQLFDSATGANGITMTTVLTATGSNSHPFPNGLDFSDGVYVQATGAWVIGVAGAEYIGG
jgi:hypothetical protein